MLPTEKWQNFIKFSLPVYAEEAREIHRWPMHSKGYYEPLLFRLLFDFQMKQIQALYGPLLMTLNCRNLEGVRACRLSSFPYRRMKTQHLQAFFNRPGSMLKSW